MYIHPSLKISFIVKSIFLFFFFFCVKVECKDTPSGQSVIESHESLNKPIVDTEKRVINASRYRCALCQSLHPLSSLFIFFFFFPSSFPLLSSPICAHLITRHCSFEENCNPFYRFGESHPVYARQLMVYE